MKKLVSLVRMIFVAKNDEKLQDLKKIFAQSTASASSAKSVIPLRKHLSPWGSY